MNDATIRVRNTVSGKIAEVTESQLSVFADVLEEVDADAKELEPGLFKPGTVEEREARSEAARKAAQTRRENAATHDSESNSEDTEAVASTEKGD